MDGFIRFLVGSNQTILGLKLLNKYPYYEREGRSNQTILGLKSKWYWTTDDMTFRLKSDFFRIEIPLKS